MRYRNDGSVQSANVPTEDNVGRVENNTLYRCMVVKVIYADSAQNITKNSANPRVLYDVVILGGFDSGQIISNCRLASIIGGNNNYFERTLRAASKPLAETRLSDQDGDIVFVQFIQGHSGYPVIVGVDVGIQPGNQTPTTEADGAVLRSEFNGIYEEITADGDWCFERRGGEVKDGAFIANEDFKVQLKLSKEEKYTRTFESGLTITEDGEADKVDIVTKGGAEVNIEGSGTITIKKDQTEVILDGNSGQISLKGDFVDLGSSVNDFAVLFTQLLSTFNRHTHQYVDATGSAGTPVPKVTQPPVAPMLSIVGSTSVKVQP